MLLDTLAAATPLTGILMGRWALISLGSSTVTSIAMLGGTLRQMALLGVRLTCGIRPLVALVRSLPLLEVRLLPIP